MLDEDEEMCREEGILENLTVLRNNVAVFQRAGECYEDPGVIRTFCRPRRDKDAATSNK
jgi:hypothetical protein